MPYRRLPNTDTARFKALTLAQSKFNEDDDYAKAAFPFPLKQRIDAFLPRFESAITNSRSAKNQQGQNSRQFAEQTKKARLYISHFIQVLNFAIIRGEIKPIARTFYGIEEDDLRVPTLISEQDLLEWGEKVINGEQARINARMGNPLYCPTIAMVRVNYEKFRQSYDFQKRLQANSARFSAEVAQYRKHADELILLLWNSIEEYYACEPSEEVRRKLCEDYGVVYFFRKGEKGYTEQQDEEEVNINNTEESV